MRNSKWVLGKPIGSGAFGDVYLACKGDVYRKEEADYVIKLEPHSNGPLFTEMHCLVRIGLPEHRWVQFYVVLVVEKKRITVY